jgi:signal transduction histidine kinase
MVGFLGGFIVLAIGFVRWVPTLAGIDEVRALAEERREANEKLRTVNHDLEARNAELDEFTYVASYDLQEPLRKLTSFSELLCEDLGENIPEQAEKDIDFIVDASRRMKALVLDLLVLSRAGRMEMDVWPVPSSTIVLSGPWKRWRADWKQPTPTYAATYCLRYPWTGHW